MSLTGQVADPASALGAFMRERFPFGRVRGVLAEVHEEMAAGRPAGADAPSWARGLIGHAIDYRIRYHFRNLGDADLVSAIAGAWNVTAGPDRPVAETVDPDNVPKAVVRSLKAEPRGSVNHEGYVYRRRRGRTERTAWGAMVAYVNFAQPQLEKYLPTGCTAEFFEWLAEETEEIAAHRRAPTEEEEGTLADYCLVLAVFEGQWRTNWKRWPPPIFRDAWPSSVEALLDSIPIEWALDVAEMGVRFQARHASWRGAQAILNPKFSGSGDVGGADGDLILDGCLWEIKSAGRKKAASDWVHQLLGYVLLDYEDEFGIEQAGFLLPRHDASIRWPLEELIERTCSPRFLTVTQLRGMLRERLEDSREQGAR